MSNIGQTVIIRTDLFDLPQDMGLLAAQVAHIHAKIVMKAVFDKDIQTDDFASWTENPYLYVKKVPNVESLHHFLAKAELAKLPVDIWEDTVYVRMSPTIKEAFKTIVGISIGPADADAIRTVVGDLPLL